jgi:hypothetical protein
MNVAGSRRGEHATEEAVRAEVEVQWDFVAATVRWHERWNHRATVQDDPSPQGGRRPWQGAEGQTRTLPWGG